MFICRKYRRKRKVVRAMSGTVNELDSGAQEQRKETGLTPEEEKKIANILIDSALFLEMSPADRQRLIQYILTMYY